MTELHINRDIAEFKINCLEQINPDFVKEIDLENHIKKEHKSILNDLIVLHSFTKITKQEQN